MYMQRTRIYILLLFFIAAFSLSSCYKSRHHHHLKEKPFVELSEKQQDSIDFRTIHHYTNNYNFVVKADSMELMRQLPEEKLSNMLTDSFTVKKYDHLVVSDIRIVPTDSVDSVWIQLGTETSMFGWIHESSMLHKVVPDDPISQFISLFSDIHLLIFLIVIVLIGVVYLFRRIVNSDAKIIHFNDIDSYYPTALVLIVASSAAFYASIQMFTPDTWQEFYFHPTLNPFAVPGILSIFLSSVWLMLIVGIACIDEVSRKLPIGGGMLYLFGLLAVCAVDYIVFSVSTLYFVGYILLIWYFYYSISIKI